jgi:hypothetical protein
MHCMGKRKADQAAIDENAAAKARRYPSRDRVRYVGVPLDIDELLAEYAKVHSTIDDVKSKNWAARVLLRKALAAEGYGAGKRKKGHASEPPQ